MGSLKKEVVVIIIAAILVTLLFVVTIEPPAPKDFVSDRFILNYSNAFFNYKVIRYPTDVSIVPSQEENFEIGFVTDPWNLRFGIAPGNGSYIKRYINIKNLNEGYNKISLKTYGNITPLVNFSKNNFVLEENESTVVEVGLYTESAEVGNYTGEIDVVIKRPKYDFLKVLT